MTERDEDGAEDIWPDDDWPELDPDVTRQLHPGTSPYHAGQHARWRRLRQIATAVVAIAAGVGGALAVKDLAPGSSPAPAATSNTGQPSTGQAGPLPQSMSAEMVVGGKVTAVSPRSITISAGPESVTARVSGSTRFSGTVTGIVAVRAGDMVMAQVSEHNGVDSLVDLQDPISVS